MTRRTFGTGLGPAGRENVAPAAVPRKHDRVAAQAVLNVLVVNAGSSTVKLSLLDVHDRTIAERELDAPRATLDEAQLRAAFKQELGEVDAVGHRVVHGGERFREAVRIDDKVEAALRDLVELAPLHQPKSIAALDAVSQALPGVPAVACFDTAFHTTLAQAASTYALPAAWRHRWRLRRYGFHGLSHSWIARRAPELLDVPAAGLRVVSCHLGAGASLCAIRDGLSVDTTMGFTPLEGLVMATRSGTVDPGMLLWLLERTAVRERDMADALEHESGLLGLAGTADMRQILARSNAGDSAATLALEVYLHHLRKGIAAMAAALGGIDALVFTGGVGERSAEIRARAVEPLSFLGMEIDTERNRAAVEDAEISAERCAVRTLVVRAREDLEISRQTRAALR
jgi:acetate kinase